ncbi:hypothetical protein HispidOSU_001649 [Sigmodon hispidus]
MEQSIVKSRMENHKWYGTAALCGQMRPCEDRTQTDQRRVLVEGDDEDREDDHLEFIKDDENVTEEGENDRDNARDEQTLKYIVGFRNLTSFLCLYTCPI